MRKWMLLVGSAAILTVASVTVMSVTAAPRKPSSPAELAKAISEIAGLDADQKAKMQGLFGHYIDEAKNVKKPSDLKKLDEQAWTELNALLKPEQKKKLWAYVARENEKQRKDIIEDVKDRQEDIRDRLDNKKKRTPAQIRKDKMEDRRDKAEDRKDRKDEVIDAKDEVRFWLNGLKLRVGNMKLPDPKPKSDSE